MLVFSRHGSYLEIERYPLITSSYRFVQVINIFSYSIISCIVSIFKMPKYVKILYYEKHVSYDIKNRIKNAVKLFSKDISVPMNVSSIMIYSNYRMFQLSRSNRTHQIDMNP